MKRYLSESENYIVISEYETVWLHFKKINRPEIIIGEFYGDPDNAIISKDETYVAMSGCGIIIYRLQEPFEEYQHDKRTKQYLELFNNPTDTWWTSNLNQSSEDNDWKYFHFTKETDDSNEEVYRFDTSTNKIEKLFA